ncbi:MAG TPA: ArsA-related P-loop ATPase [Candidatus Binataceae bacterium]|nr:ArsA-related P-loop ATPase [Candidatus Binataceae bacterium]
MLKELLARRVVVLLGKGGVGKSSLSAALALAASRRGAHTLVMECDSRAPIASLYGIEPVFEPTEAVGFNLMVLDGRHTLEEYLRIVVPGRLLLKAVFSSRLYQFFVQAAPGLRELMALGKIYYETERKPGDDRRWDLIIVDAPASGQALSWLKMPTAARATFGDSIVGKEANNITGMLTDRERCAIVQVTTADSLAVSETIETFDDLDKLELTPAAIFFNRYVKLSFSEDDADALAKRRVAREQKKAIEHLGEIARAELRRNSESAAALAQVQHKAGDIVIEIPEHRGLFGTTLVDALADDLNAVPARSRSRRAAVKR